MQQQNIGRGVFWKMLERLGFLGTQFVLQIVLARILSPEHYGTLAIMIVFVNLATVFVQTGFNTALIQNKDVTDEDYSSVFWVSFGVAGALYAIIFFTAPLIAQFYKMPDIVMPLRVLTLMLFPGALNSVQLAKVSRELDFKKVFFSNIGGVLISGVAGIVIAYMGGGLWALVAQTLLNSLIACVVMRFTVKLRIRLVCNLKRVKVLFGFGWKLLVSSLVDTLYQEANSLIIGRKYDSETLGYYNQGQKYPQVMFGVINGAIQSVMLPAMASKQEDKESVKDIMRTSITTSSYLVFPLMAGLAAVATPVVSLLLTDKWLPCVPYLQIACFSFAFWPVHTCNLQAINAMGRSDVFLKLEIIKKAYAAIALVIAVVFFDSPIALAMTSVVLTVISCFVNAYPNKKLIDYSYFEQIRDILPSMLLSLVMCGVVLLVGRLQINTLLLLLLQFAVGVAVYFTLSLVFRPKPYRFLMQQIKEKLKGKKQDA